jgi:hypothetical protein
MSVAETFWLFYKTFAIGLFTAAWMICGGVCIVQGYRTVIRWIEIGHKAEELERSVR